jgi:hypothetical protein
MSPIKLILGLSTIAQQGAFIVGIKFDFMLFLLESTAASSK